MGKTSPQRRTVKQRLFSVAKVAISGLIIYWLSQKFDYANAIGRIGDVSVSTLLLIVCLSIAQITLLGLRWHLVGSWWQTAFRRRDAFVTLFAGLFFGQALPSSVGGDAVRVVLLSRNHGFAIRTAVFATLADRITGLLSLTLLSLIAAPTFFSSAASRGILPAGLDWKTGPIIAAVLLFLALAILVVSRRARDWLAELIRNTLERVLLISSINRYSLAGVFGLGVLSHIALLTSAFWWFSQIHSDMDVSAFFVLAPVALLFSALPISIGGWGVREASFVALFTLIGVSANDALLLGLGIGLLGLFQGLVSGLFWLANGVVQRHRASSPSS